jgi:hypothetical protein
MKIKLFLSLFLSFSQSRTKVVGRFQPSRRKVYVVVLDGSLADPTIEETTDVIYIDNNPSRSGICGFFIKSVHDEENNASVQDS